MMSSTVWARRILSLVALHSAIGTMMCNCVTRPAAVADKWPTTLTLGCSRHVAQSC
jgi:hypothetical protein